MQKLRKYGVFTLALAMSASALIPTAAASPKAGTALPAAASSATPQVVDMTTLVPGPKAKPAGAEPR